jgi:hypothetical protein
VLNACELFSEPRLVTTSTTSWLRPRSLVCFQHPAKLTVIAFQEANSDIQDGSRERPLETVQPLAEDLGITVDTSCDRDDQDCVADVVDNYDGPGNILICWEHDNLHDIVKALGDKNAPDYPDGS